MAITWDAPLAAVVATALHRRLAGGRLRALVLDHEARSVLLWFRESTLVFRLAPDAGALLLLDPAEPLEGARRLSAEVASVTAPPDDRLIYLDVRKVRGGRERFRIVLELMTNQWNAVVAEGEDRRIRHVLRERDAGDRPLYVGATYEPPPPSGRMGADGELPFERWRDLLEPVPAGERRGTLLSSVAWTSSLNAGWLLGDATTAEGAAVPAERADADASRDARLRAGWERWRNIAAVAGGAVEPGPVLLTTESGLQPYPLSLGGSAGVPEVDFGPIDDVLDAFRIVAESGEAGVAAAIPSAWIRALEKRAAGARGKVRGLQREFESAPDPAEVRALGDLILARFHEVPRAAERAELTGFDGEPVDVELDPRLSPQENAARYYDEATRAERALEKIPAMIDEATAEAERLEALLARVEAGEADAQAVRAELPGPDEGGRSPADEGPSLPYRAYRSSGGLEIRVGRGSKQNDDLTFHHSRPDDVWMHARHAAGAHVILRWAGEGNPPARDLAEAAVLAALHSKARTSGSVPVDWTRRKYVRSPRGAPPGRVVPDRVQTVFVEPDEEVEKRLRQGAEG